MVVDRICNVFMYGEIETLTASSLLTYVCLKWDYKINSPWQYVHKPYVELEGTYFYPLLCHATT